MKYKQLPKDGTWQDEADSAIPYNRTTPLERLKEKEAYNLLTGAEAISTKLQAFKKQIYEIVDKVLSEARKENSVLLNGKGNFTWYNFNRSIKIEVNVNEQIKFDELQIESAKEILLNMIRENVNGDDFIISLIEDAFQTSRGKLDTKKVLGLKRHSSRIKKDEMKSEWDRAMSIIDKSISRPSSKTYFKVWKKDATGEYQNIDLNFSSI